jgi:flagellar hook-basal body complex protein FliE
MPARSKIEQLPPEIREELNQLFIKRNFSGYDEIAAIINEKLSASGLEITISRSGVHRYGQEFEDKIAMIKIATEQARAITDAVGDDVGKMGDALTSLCQERAFQVLVKMQELDPDNIDFSKLTVAIAKLNKTAVDQKKWAAEMRVKTKQTAEDVVMVAKKGGMSEKTAEEIRKKILGIV